MQFKGGYHVRVRHKNAALPSDYKGMDFLTWLGSNNGKYVWVMFQNIKFKIAYAL